MWGCGGGVGDLMMVWVVGEIWMLLLLFGFVYSLVLGGSGSGGGGCGRCSDCEVWVVVCVWSFLVVFEVVVVCDLVVLELSF